MGERLERLARRGGRERAERGDALGGERARVGEGVIQRAAPADPGEPLAELGCGRTAVGEARAQAWDAVERVEQRQRQLAFPQVGSGELVGRRPKVEDVVGDLKRAPDGAAVDREGLRFVQRAGAERGGRGTPSDQARGLAVDDLEVVLAGGVDATRALQLQHLALGHLGDGGGERGADGSPSLGVRRRDRARDTEVAGEDGDGVAVDDVRGGLAAANIALVDDVVVQQRAEVDQLAARHQPNAGDLLDGARAERGQHRTQALAARVCEVGRDDGERADLAADQRSQHRLGGQKFVGDQRECRGRVGHVAPSDAGLPARGRGA